MVKWIGGCALAVVVIVIIGAVIGYNKYKTFTEPGGATTVGIHAPVDRVFASLANGDSIAAAAGDPNSIVTTRHGPLQAGDTLHVQSDAPGGGGKRQQLLWTVSEVRSNQLLALDLHESNGSVIASRRDSLVASGDSTLVISTVASPFMDSLKTRIGDSSRAGSGAVLGMSSKLMLSAFRLMSEDELRDLKAHIEGLPKGVKKP